MESTILENFKREVEIIKGEISRLREQLSTETRKEKQLRAMLKALAANPIISKSEAADILCVSERHLQRIREDIGLKWKQNGRDSYYFLESIVIAIYKFQLPWNRKAFERVQARVKNLPPV